MTKTFKTNLRCAACEAKIRPLFDGEPAVERWSVDFASADKLLTVDGPTVDPKQVAALLEQAGYASLGESGAAPVAAPTAASNASEPPESYFPLALVVGYISGTVALIEVAAGALDAARAMANFMAGFFLAFSFFKLLDVRAFADSFAMYDVVAARSRVYSLAYPFIELALGAAYLVRLWPKTTNIVTLVLMLLGTAGVARSLLERRKIKCACLGTGFNLPMSTVTLVEDLTMAAMAAAMLARS